MTIGPKYESVVFLHNTRRKDPFTPEYSPEGTFNQPGLNPIFNQVEELLIDRPSLQLASVAQRSLGKFTPQSELAHQFFPNHSSRPARVTIDSTTLKRTTTPPVAGPLESSLDKLLHTVPSKPPRAPRERPPAPQIDFTKRLPRFGCDWDESILVNPTDKEFERDRALKEIHAQASVAGVVNVVTLPSIPVMAALSEVFDAVVTLSNTPPGQYVMNQSKAFVKRAFPELPKTVASAADTIEQGYNSWAQSYSAETARIADKHASLGIPKDLSTTMREQAISNAITLPLLLVAPALGKRIPKLAPQPKQQLLNVVKHTVTPPVSSVVRREAAVDALKDMYLIVYNPRALQTMAHSGPVIDRLTLKTFEKALSKGGSTGSGGHVPIEGTLGLFKRPQSRLVEEFSKPQPKLPGTSPIGEAPGVPSGKELTDFKKGLPNKAAEKAVARYRDTLSRLPEDIRKGIYQESPTVVEHLLHTGERNFISQISVTNKVASIFVYGPKVSSHQAAHEVFGITQPVLDALKSTARRHGAEKMLIQYNPRNRRLDVSGPHISHLGNLPPLSNSSQVLITDKTPFFPVFAMNVTPQSPVFDLKKALVATALVSSASIRDAKAEPNSSRKVKAKYFDKMYVDVSQKNWTSGLPDGYEKASDFAKRFPKIQRIQDHLSPEQIQKLESLYDTHAPEYFHATDRKGLEGIFRTKFIEPSDPRHPRNGDHKWRTTTSPPGVYVTTQPWDRYVYDDYVLMLDRQGVEYRNEVNCAVAPPQNPESASKSFRTGDLGYWAALKKPVSVEHIVGVAVDRDVDQKKLKKELHDWTGRDIPVIKIADLEESHSQREASLGGVYVPKAWEEEDVPRCLPKDLQNLVDAAAP